MEVTSLWSKLMLLTLLNTYSAQTNDDAFPHIKPHRLQFFTYESIQIDCKRFTGSTEWRVMKRASRWEDSTTSKDIKPTYGSHNEEYWCQNREGERSRSLNISIVEADSVILESPVLPVMEGQTVTLRCRTKTPTHNLTADFYKDGNLEKTGSAGDMIIHNVSKSDEGLYKCSISGYEESPNSWLAVRVFVASSSPKPESTTTQAVNENSPHPAYPGSNQLPMLLPVISTILFVAVLLVLVVVGLLQCQKQKAACFSTDLPASGPDPGGQEMMEGDVTYAEVTTKKIQARGEVPDHESATATYAVVTPQKKEQDHESAGATYAALAPQREKNDISL